MSAALIAIVVTILFLGGVAGIVVVLRNRKKTPYVRSAKQGVHSITTVGVSARGTKRSSHKKVGSIQVGTEKTSASNPLDSLRARFVGMGVFAGAVFGTLAFRLWGMQILGYDEYVKKAKENTYTTVSTVAPRGCIYDAAGIPLIKNRLSLTVLAEADVADNRSVVQRLSVLLGIPHTIVRQRIQDTTGGAQSQRIVASDVKLRDIAFILEHRDAFPGVSTQTRTVREYPWGALAAHVLGYVGSLTEKQLATQKEGVSLTMGDMYGQSGVEASYEDLLAGTHGQRVLIADADGAVRQVVREDEATKGNDIFLTIKAPVQQVADRALAKLIAPSGVIGAGKGTAASLVCMDVTDGSIVALANYPTYTPESFIGGISNEAWDLFTTEESHYPLLNRALEGVYPAASCFKAFTGLAGLEKGFATSSEAWNCAGTWIGFGKDYPQKCWNTFGHGAVGFRTGIVLSCDVVFYEIAKDFYNARNTIGDEALQDFIKLFGFSKKTGIDLQGEAVGVIPTPAWKTKEFSDVPEEAAWLPGDMSNMSIGQGYVLVTPVQMAVGYAAVATGKVIRPHVLKEAKNSRGDTVLTDQGEVKATLPLSESNLALMRDALRGVATEDATVSAAFRAQGVTSAAAKTGTAEKAGKKDFGWFACYAPYDDPKYVVACIVEEGGAGAQSACPISAEVLSAALRYDEGTLDTTITPLAGSSGKSIPLANEGTTSSGRTD